jgi:hypothetical protein
MKSDKMRNISSYTASALSGLREAIEVSASPNLFETNRQIYPAFVSGLGFRLPTVNSKQGECGHNGQCAGYDDRHGTGHDDWQGAPIYTWQSYKKTGILEDLRSLLSRWPIISFANWSEIDGASELWDGLRRDVFKSLPKRDFDFVFYLGDPARRLAQDVDEILDIIGDYSLCGRVSLVLDQDEAYKLWTILYGDDTDTAIPSPDLPGAAAKYISLFTTMNIHYLIIHGSGQTVCLSKQEQFRLDELPQNGTGIPRGGRDNFNAGYSLGLQLRLGMAECVALGLAVSGSFCENGSTPGRDELLTYIKRWIAKFQ